MERKGVMRIPGIRVFLVSCLLFLPLNLTAALEAVQPKPLKGDGTLSLHNLHLGESVTVQYREGGLYNPKGLEKIYNLLRCRGNQEKIDIALPLIELIDHLEDHFHVDTVHVISGYRSPKFNAHLKQIGRKVASRSRHMQGEAIDIRLPSVDMRKVRNYLVSLKTGGVGYYGRNNFVHVDVGPFRTW